MYVGWGIKLPPPATTDRQHGSSLHRDLILVAKSGESKPHVEVGAGMEAKRKPMPDSGASTQHGITLLMRGVSWLPVKSEYRAAAGVSRVEIAFCHRRTGGHAAGHRLKLLSSGNPVQSSLDDLDDGDMIASPGSKASKRATQQ
ncbi:hypothetical protein CCHR01_10824 [Colletotrichum chrysophilum]|uniref:Uncharacterized protein n=1 Tax=Colletotrichum chrysophilum TaxID=1836956 RepID=A0AAD9EJ09_9PEZI|nr:hypothetical protein CCHR01_10824 [Colletotrichum chrysophilum]